MKLPDVNLLLYAFDAAAPRHDEARRWLEERLEHGAELCSSDSDFSRFPGPALDQSAGIANVAHPMRGRRSMVSSGNVDNNIDSGARGRKDHRAS